MISAPSNYQITQLPIHQIPGCPLILKTKAVSSPIDRAGDGLRILVTRFRGRGLPTSRYDVWMPSLGPSEQTLKELLKAEVMRAAR